MSLELVKREEANFLLCSAYTDRCIGKAMTSRVQFSACRLRLSNRSSVAEFVHTAVCSLFQTKQMQQLLCGRCRQRRNDSRLDLTFRSILQKSIDVQVCTIPGSTLWRRRVHGDFVAPIVVEEHHCAGKCSWSNRSDADVDAALI